MKMLKIGEILIIKNLSISCLIDSEKLDFMGFNVIKIIPMHIH